ncbi:glycoside hydrolase family 97 protein [Algibacter amylolyticus]|uniref:Glycoside hydrolase family 97 protein n=1 Tax=Algibacter amylolyticus TaxID=1608400 RepID=A0A5M7B781_9FLAO|nr:glycoside hydrolase family 97 protein [Algibacter amylolyticus]KAA5825182.1 glycoside hydrolase family 97 protein [Algibacter amylolyticus]MBB5268703.1 alpha-glucosidase [Algibacter amylolyticus]TSJ77676.1 glycoside hydrolase family 97 protein [Algibacter amylolyticus]
MKYGIIKKITFLCLVAVCFSCKNNDAITVSSPDASKKMIFLQGENQNDLTFSVFYRDKEVIQTSVLELLSDDLNFSGKVSVEKIENSSENTTWTSRFNELSTIPDHYNQTKIYLKQGEAKLNIIARAYNEGVAFAYEVPEQNNIKDIGLSENIHFNFPEDYPVWSTPKREKGVLTAQGEYRKIPITALQEGAERPLLIEINDSIKIALAEAQLVDYARLSFSRGNTSKYSIVSSLDGKMGEQKQDTITGAVISERKIEGAKVHKKLPFQSPWRVVMMGNSYADLLEKNYIIQNLNPPSTIDDSWVEPGKVLRETTLTTQGGFAAIDFVASHNMQYVHFDAGWYGNEMDNESDATTVTLDPKRSKGPFDIEAICKYAKEKGVKVMLYINRRALEGKVDEVFPVLKKWGVSGVKYGFVRVGDENATTWMHEAVKKAAKYKLVIDIHDEYRPTGFSRTYPNLLTQEGIRGDEETVPNEHTLITMFTRMLAGAADNTVCYYNKRVDKMGSHASQMAKTVCIFSPLQFLYWYDKAPAAPIKDDGLWGDTKTIGNEPELEFFNNVPTTWDETKVLHAEIGELGVIARRSGTDWFIGGINGIKGREVALNFAFLDANQEYIAKLYTDDESINTRTKVNIEDIKISNKSKLNLNVKSNNGFVMQITKLN